MPETTPVPDRPVTSRAHQLARLTHEQLLARVKHLARGDAPGALALLCSLASRETLIATIATMEGEVVSDDLAADVR